MAKGSEQEKARRARRTKEGGRGISATLNKSEADTMDRARRVLGTTGTKDTLLKAMEFVVSHGKNDLTKEEVLSWIERNLK